jgi:hypothetical protein
MTTGRINQVTTLAGEAPGPPPEGGGEWSGEGPPLSAPDAREDTPILTGGPPRIVLLPPPSSPGDLPPRSERARKRTPTSVAWDPKEEDTIGQSRPEGGYRPRLAPKSLAATMAIGQQPTDLTDANREPVGPRRPQRQGRAPKGVLNTAGGHRTPRHRPGRQRRGEGRAIKGRSQAGKM